MLEGVTIEQLRTLRAVAEAGSFSGAARKLGRVQAAVSQAMDRLEAQLGLRLFDRTGRVPKLTRHGEAVATAGGRGPAAGAGPHTPGGPPHAGPGRRRAPRGGGAVPN